MDDVLKKLSEAPLPAELAQIDDAILVTLAIRQRDARATKRIISMVTVLALGMGYVGGSLMPTAAQAASSKLTLADTKLAPSTLLDML